MNFKISMQMAALGTGDDADAYFERISRKNKELNSIPRNDYWPLIGLDAQVKIITYFIINWPARIQMYANISGERYFARKDLFLDALYCVSSDMQECVVRVRKNLTIRYDTICVRPLNFIAMQCDDSQYIYMNTAKWRKEMETEFAETVRFKKGICYFEVEHKRFTKLHCNNHLLKVWKKVYRYDEKKWTAIEIKNGIIDCRKYTCISHLSKTRHRCFSRKTLKSNAHAHVSNLYNYFESRLRESSYVKPVWQ